MSAQNQAIMCILNGVYLLLHSNAMPSCIYITWSLHCRAAAQWQQTAQGRTSLAASSLWMSLLVAQAATVQPVTSHLRQQAFVHQAPTSMSTGEVPSFSHLCVKPMTSFRFKVPLPQVCAPCTHILAVFFSLPKPPTQTPPQFCQPLGLCLFLQYLFLLQLPCYTVHRLPCWYALQRLYCFDACC